MGVNYIGISQNSAKIENLKAEIQASKGDKKYKYKSELARLYYRSKPHKTYSLGKEILNYALNNTNHSLEEKAYVRMGIGVYLLGKVDSAIYYCEKALNLNKITSNSEEKEFALNLISLANNRLGNYDDAISFGNEALQLRREKNDSMGIAASLGNLAPIYQNTGQYDKAAEYIYEAIEIYEAKMDTIGIVGRLLTMVQLMNRSGNDENEKEVISRALDLVGQTEFSFLKADVLSTMANYFITKEIYDSALIYENKALDIYKQMNNPESIATSYSNLARIHQGQNNFKLARLYYHKSIQIYNSSNLIPKINVAYESLGSNFLQTGILDSAEYYLLKAYNSGKTINQARIVQIASRDLYTLYKLKNNSKKALQYHEVFTHYQDSLAGVKSKERIAELEAKYESSEKERQIAILQHKQDLQESRERTIIAVNVGVVIILILLLLGVWQKRKNDKQIHKQIELVHKKEKELAESELEKSKLKEEELQQSLVYKSKQLSTHALHMMQKNTMLQEIQSDIKNLSNKADTDDKPDYKRINLQINQSLRSDKDWDVFKLYFEDVNRNFYSKLKEINPDLTTNDHRLCALIKLNMNSKEMASVLNVAPNSIKSSRYRLKKKLGLTTEADLEEFIRNLN